MYDFLAAIKSINAYIGLEHSKILESGKAIRERKDIRKCFSYFLLKTKSLNECTGWKIVQDYFPRVQGHIHQAIRP